MRYSIGVNRLYNPLNTSPLKRPTKKVSQTTSPVSSCVNITTLPPIIPTRLYEKSTEQTVRSFLFVEISPLLDKYFDLIDSKKANHSRPNVLYNFYSVRGRLVDLMLYFAQKDVNTFSKDDLFTTSTPFTDLFDILLEEEGNEVLRATSSPIVDDVNISDNGDEISNRYVYLLTKYVPLIKESIRGVVRSVAEIVYNKYGEEMGHTAIVRLIFERYLFVPISNSTRHITAFYKLLSDGFFGNVGKATGQMGNAVDYTIGIVLSTPPHYQSPYIISRHEETLEQLCEVIKEDASLLRVGFKGDFDIVFDTVRKRKEGNIDLLVASNELQEWRSQRLDRKCYANMFLKEQVKKALQINDFLRMKILQLKNGVF
ncbi:hypothetical protein EIN_173660 [Entamoeba invadens IP1]|uniref:Ras-GAP domain-containing protein n=1 Tax=Entamoeba invadens IP1 TaxID=370355 RepID=A0A0A1TW39_ENTIV|nr:hypothetical protein EIN_173660 [Entamoeba invadens IP1]ELP84691.1 hypothetical protein EIN_173660 [Entamoeba invadens IP1]|eukprot:XP_004184037.1 hypothetical protein EIN_173660 [Entamoeba invadens IP1]